MQPHQDDAAPVTGTPDHVYDLVVTFQRALEDALRFHEFAKDADGAGDAELAEWFTELSQSDKEIAEKAKRLLALRLG